MKFPTIPFFNFSINKIEKNKPTEINTPKQEEPKIKTLARDNNNINRERSIQIITELLQMTKMLTAKDIKLWRMAWQQAINVENPKRYTLLNLYDDAMIDLHLWGAINNRKMSVLGKCFKVVDKDGNENQDATKLLKSRWFKQFMILSLDSIFYGYSLIQFGDIIIDNKLKFTNVQLVPRHHVIPEFGVFIKDLSDDIKKKGISYLEPPYSDWCIGVGETKDLGLLLKMCPHTISKKHQFAFWDQFSEIFGMPIRIATTTSRNQQDKDTIADMLENMGSAAWGLFPDGTNIDLKGAANKDAFNVYDKRIDRANSEMSKGILGQTMSMDNGSSKSQGEVHERVAEMITTSDADSLADIINDDLFPFLIKHSFPLQNLYFEWDDTYEYTPQEMKEIEDMLLIYYDIEQQYFIDKYKVPITGKKQLNSNPTAPVAKKKN